MQAKSARATSIIDRWTHFSHRNSRLNEERRLPQTLERIMEWLGQGSIAFHELIVVDDGSRDATTSVVERTPAGPLIGSIAAQSRKSRQGLRPSAMACWKPAESGSSTLTPICRRPSPKSRSLYAAAIEQKADVAIGSRALNRRARVSGNQPVFREYSGRFFNLVVRTVDGTGNCRDTQCGFKLFRARQPGKIFPLQKQDGFSFDVEDLVITKKLGLRAIEVPVRWANVGRDEGKAHSRVEVVHDLLQIRKGPLVTHALCVPRRDSSRRQALRIFRKCDSCRDESRQRHARVRALRVSGARSLHAGCLASGKTSPNETSGRAFPNCDCWKLLRPVLGPARSQQTIPSIQRCD